jgi:hypothetical protein
VTSVKDFDKLMKVGARKLEVPNPNRDYDPKAKNKGKFYGWIFM